MTARAIVTSHPDIQCSMCGRRLLRGESPDVFFAAGQRRIVCELCGPRASQEGWLRETQAQPDHEEDDGRAQRGRSLWERLWQRGEGSAEARPRSGPMRLEGLRPDPYELGASSGEPFDFIGPVPGAEADHGSENGSANGVSDAGEQLGAMPIEAIARTDPASGLPEDLLAAALAAFNASEHSKRVASIGRLLGPPLVSLRGAPGREDGLWITIAWEICWHRYEVLPDAPEGARRIAEGMELEELSPPDRTANALADEHGRLHPAPV